MDRWDEYLDMVDHAINSRILKIHGYTPAQLFLGFNIRLHPLDQTLAEKLRYERIKDSVDEGINEGDLEVREYDLRLAQVEEVRELVRERVVLDLDEKEAEAKVPRYHKPQVGDLVLRRRFNVEKSLGMKLYSKWDGPYRMVQLSTSGTAGYLEDLKTGKVLGRYALDALKVFVPRESMSKAIIEEGAWVSLKQGLEKELLVGGRAVSL